MDGEDDDARVLGLAGSDTFASPNADNVIGRVEEEEEEEEEFLNLGSLGNDDDDDNGDDDDDDDDGDGGSTAAAAAAAAAANPSNDDDGGDGDVGNGGGANGLLSDAELARITTKSEAKALGRELYKRWKKLRRRSRRGRSRHGSNEKKSKGRTKSKRDKSKHKGGSKSSRKRHRRSGDGDDDDDGDGGDEDKTNAHAAGSRRRKRSRREKPIAHGDEDLGAAPFAELSDVLQVEEAMAQHNNNAISTKRRRGAVKCADVEARPRKLTLDARREVLRGMASTVVNAMREARLRDEVDISQHLPPLHRVGIVDYVMTQCRREALRAFLIEEGILQEMSTWLYDFTRNELAAYELRSAALDILLRFPIDGELGTGVARNGDDILDAFTGMTREHLIHTDLGSSVNALRQDKHEVHQNRTKAVRLLERLSRAMAGGVKTARRDGASVAAAAAAAPAAAAAAAGCEPCSVVTWKCQNDPTVAPPFHIVPTGTEVFQSALIRPDPLDPMSYLRVPPRRAPKAYVTNLGGNVGTGEK